ncbi:MAG: ethylbenzene dehydrogenase-related protein [Planctomycetota bacterium]|jgi:hypothetical protein
MRYCPYLSIALLLALVAVSCAGTEPVSTTEVVAVVDDELPAEPGDPAWGRAPVHVAELLLQDMVEPRLLEVSTPHVRVSAITDGRRIAFKLTWDDATQDDLPGASRFVDAVAVQIPGKTEADVPAPQMGETGRRVEISYWRASWQAVVDGREDVIQSLYPDASVDHYPFEAPSLEEGSEAKKTLTAQYAPARALNHLMEGPRERAVEDLLAEGPGTLTPADEQHSEGAGRRGEGGWEVVIVRPLPEGLSPGERSQVAFAVWDGTLEEVGARKMRSAWIPLHLQGEG